MKNIFKVSKFLLYTFVSQTIICFSVIAFNILLSVIVVHGFGKADSSIGSIDVIAFIWILILGLTNFIYSFKFMMCCGISRKMFYKALMFSAVVTSAVWAIATVIMSLIGRALTNITVIYEAIYKGYNVFGASVFNFALLLMMLLLGTLILLVYYRSSKKLKMIVSALPFVLYGLLALINNAVEGAFFKAISDFLIRVLGLSATPNPYIAALSFFVCAIAFCPFIYLLLKKAPIKN